MTVRKNESLRKHAEFFGRTSTTSGIEPPALPDAARAGADCSCDLLRRCDRRIPELGLRLFEATHGTRGFHQKKISIVISSFIQAARLAGAG
jgi:hypothetical protein